MSGVYKLSKLNSIRSEEKRGEEGKRKQDLGDMTSFQVRRRKVIYALICMKQKENFSRGSHRQCMLIKFGKLLGLFFGILLLAS
jgi:hypothetical protein